MSEYGSIAPSGVPGTAPMTDPQESRHRHHYGYAFIDIPAFVFAEEDTAFAALALSRGEVARQLWTSSGGSEEDAECLMVTLARTHTHDVAVITMPPIRQSPEAIYVAVARPHKRSGPGDESAPFRICYLEAGIHQPVLGEKYPNGNHGNHNKTCEPVFEKFAALLDVVLGSSGAA